MYLTIRCVAKDWIYPQSVSINQLLFTETAIVVIVVIVVVVVAVVGDSWSEWVCTLAVTMALVNNVIQFRSEYICARICRTVSAVK